MMTFNFDFEQVKSTQRKNYNYYLKIIQDNIKNTDVEAWYKITYNLSLVHP